MNKRNINNNNGITLVALIVTIIVLLIIVSVSVTIISDDKLFDIANNTVDNATQKLSSSQQASDNMLNSWDNPSGIRNDSPNIVTVTWVDGVDNSIIKTMQVPSGVTILENKCPDTKTHYGYVFIDWYVNGSSFNFSNSITSNTIFTAHFSEDVLIDPTIGPNGNGGDGIPDGNQIIVTYSATNSIVSFDSTVVTKNENGIAVLQREHIPTVTVLPGYDNDVSWSRWNTCNWS